MAAMHMLVVGTLSCAGLSACSGSDGKPQSAGAAGSQSGAGAAGTQSSSGAGAGGAATAGSAGSDPNWPSYADAEKGPHSTRVLVLLLDFADSDQNQLVPNAEAAWGKMIFGHGNGNDFWYQTSAGQFQLLPAPETQLTPNNGPSSAPGHAYRSEGFVALTVGNRERRPL